MVFNPTEASQTLRVEKANLTELANTFESTNKTSTKEEDIQAFQAEEVDSPANRRFLQINNQVPTLCAERAE